jgi:predicted DNA-binding protein (MmcQ/YjbR family)
MNIEKLRQYCLSFPHATEDVKWGNDLCFCIANKMFCVTGLEPSHEGASFKVKAEEFDEMTAKPNIIPAPYVARYKWVYVERWDALTQAEWEYYLVQSYNLVRSKLPPGVKKKLESTG